MFRAGNQSSPSIAAKLAEALAEGSYRTKARPEQLPPPDQDPWNGWVVCAGRGFGKSWVATNFANECAQSVGRIALIAPTAGDVRDVLVEGPSGILATAPSWFRPEYQSTNRKLEWPNGCIASLFSAEEPDRLRGPQFEISILDEFAAYGNNMQATWDMMSFGLRLGKQPRFLITTTPRPIKLLREIMARKDVVVTTGSTFANEANLAPTFLESIRQRYEGTRLGRQEMYAEILTDTPGAMWQVDWIENNRRKAYPFDGLKRIVVAIDPAVTSGENSDETGIIVAGIDFADRGYIIEDLSGRYQPHEWAAIAVAAYKRHQADRIVGEKNNGGDMIEATIRSVDASVSFKAVTATRGKVVRAEPISALYEQGRVSHVGVFNELESQMLQFTSDFSKASAGYSPDRLDAMVWALTELMLEKSKPKLIFV
jgi:phage terminase large subunit-like protein